jgi:SPX domain protein involved in polyphosphate accumulation
MSNEINKLLWMRAPIKTQWGDNMVETCIALDNDHTLSLYCERDQTHKVANALKQKWKGITKRELESFVEDGYSNWWKAEDYMRAVEKLLKEKNK